MHRRWHSADPSADVNFFASQEAARRQSRWLVLAFIASVVFVVVAIDVAVLVLHRATDSTAYEGLSPPALGAWAAMHGRLVAWTSLLVAGVIGGASLYRIRELKGGGGVVARALGGVRVERDTQDASRRRLLNIVEEMSIASGTPMPEVYVLEREWVINAFSAGTSPANAAISVTYGALERLDRDALQAVIAHEFSHVLNGDMRLSIRLMGLVFGLLALGLAARSLLRLARYADRAAAPILVGAAAVYLIGSSGLICTRFIQAWISRRRESLADASAVQFTRNPEGLCAALLHGAAQGKVCGFAVAESEEVAHMLFLAAEPRLFGTHPPVLDRLRAVDPSFTQSRIDAETRRLQRQWEAEAPPEEPVLGAPRPVAARPRPAPMPGPAPMPVQTPGTVPSALVAAVVASAGAQQTRHIEHAQALRAALPAWLDARSADPAAAQALVLAVLLSRDARIRQRQLAYVATALGQAEASAVQGLLQDALKLELLHRLPVVLRIFPTLRQLPERQRRRLLEVLQALARFDARIDTFEFALLTLLSRSLGDELGARQPHGTATLDEMREPIALLFAVLAGQGADPADAVTARRAYEEGLATLFPRERPEYAEVPDWANTLGGALDRLATLRPLAKQLLVEGLVRTIAHDGQLSAGEAELLRTVCAVVQCPLPPLLNAP